MNHRAKTLLNQNPAGGSSVEGKSLVTCHSSLDTLCCFLIIWICFEFRISSFEFFLASHSLGAPFDGVYPERSRRAQDMLCAFARVIPTWLRRRHPRGAYSSSLPSCRVEMRVSQGPLLASLGISDERSQISYVRSLLSG